MTGGGRRGWFCRGGGVGAGFGRRNQSRATGLNWWQRASAVPRELQEEPDGEGSREDEHQLEKALAAIEERLCALEAEKDSP